MFRLRLAAVALAVAAALPVAAQTGDDFVPVTDKTLQKPDDGDWLSWRRTLDGWAYSPLTEINKRNVAKLTQVWTHAIGDGPQEGTPLVYRGVMYVPNRGDLIQAFDAKSGTELWQYQRKFPEGFRGSTKRNIAIYGDTLIGAGGDNQIYAIDARTGTLRWETPVHEPMVRAHATGGPIVANGKVITGRQCQPDATFEGCVITAHDAKTGKELWRTHTIPQPGEPGSETWGDVPLEQRWHVGTWMAPSFDPVLNKI
jgi:alcohol dehydrogenase (cytochrome c)